MFIYTLDLSFREGDLSNLDLRLVNRALNIFVNYSIDSIGKFVGDDMEK